MRRLGFSLVAAAATISLFASSAASATEEHASLVSVPISSPADLTRLERTGLDLTEDVSPSDATVALYSDADRARLAAAGFSWTTLIGDLSAASRSDRAAETRAASAPTASALPSGRVSYRVYDDYVNDLDALAAAHPDLVRKRTIGQTFEGRDIVGVEIAADVNREDDGRPVYLQMGLHHAREWPSGELPMEFAIDLVEGYGSDSRITALLDQVRVFVFPVINVDGFLVSRGSAPNPGGVPTVVGGFGEFRRKNCRPAPGDAADASLPCSLRRNSGVDLNRNYGYYWGMAGGSSTSPSADDYRGTGPFSEPESQAVREFVSGIHPTVFITNHTYGGDFLRQPGFNASFLPQDGLGSSTPDEPRDEAARRRDGERDGLGLSAGMGSRRHHRSHGGLELLCPGDLRLHARGPRHRLPRPLPGHGGGGVHRRLQPPGPGHPRGLPDRRGARRRPRRAQRPDRRRAAGGDAEAPQGVRLPDLSAILLRAHSDRP